MTDWTIRICPKCGKQYIGEPSLSRKDNKTKICGLCGLQEALQAMKEYMEKRNEEKDNLG